MSILPGGSDLQSFNFNGIALRAKLIDGEPWFVAADLAAALGYSDAYEASKHVLDSEAQNLQIAGFGNRGVKLVNESGLYAIIMRSNKPEAVDFRLWVTSEVLPSIRKTGSYEKPRTLEERSLELIGELSARVEDQRRELEAARPKVQTYDKILTRDHTFGFRDLCKAIREHFPVNEADVKRLLREKKILTSNSFRMDVYSHAVDQGWAVRRPAGKWGNKERFQPRFTQKTVDWLLEELAPLEDAA
ncbi:BRO family protein [Rothia sp. LK2588]|uniref:BRO family protein n=1 Tax=Rothia sp. LK2588 TaxID=3114369 RepID=UPI0034CEEBD9